MPISRNTPHPPRRVIPSVLTPKASGAAGQPASNIPPVKASDVAVIILPDVIGAVLPVLRAVAVRPAIRLVSGDYEVTAQDSVIIATQAITVHLLSAVGLDGAQFKIKNGAASGIVQVIALNAETIDGASRQNVAKNAVLGIVSDGTNWRVI